MHNKLKDSKLLRFKRINAIVLKTELYQYFEKVIKFLKNLEY